MFAMRPLSLFHLCAAMLPLSAIIRTPCTLTRLTSHGTNRVTAASPAFFNPP
jgi:hypothetical protein